MKDKRLRAMSELLIVSERISILKLGHRSSGDLRSPLGREYPFGT